MAPLGNRHAGAERHLACSRVHRADLGQPTGRQNDLPVAAGHPAANQAGVASLRHHADPIRRAPSKDSRHLLDIRRTHHRERLPHVPAGPVALIRGTDVGIDEDMVRADDCVQVCEERAHMVSMPRALLNHSGAWHRNG
jgi:hypothetical protein